MGIHKNNKVYAMYSGDEFVDLGTAHELSAKYDVSVKEIYWRACATRFHSTKHQPNTYQFFALEEDTND